MSTENLHRLLHLNQGASRQVPTDPLHLAQELEVVASYMRSVADQAMIHVHSVRQRSRFLSSSSSSSGDPSSSADFNSVGGDAFDRLSAVSSHKRARSADGHESVDSQEHAVRVKGVMSPDGTFEYSAEIGTASSSAKVLRRVRGDQRGQDTSVKDSSWSIPVSEIKQPTNGIHRTKQRTGQAPAEQSEPIIHFPKPQGVPNNPPPPGHPSSSDRSSKSTKMLRVTETFELASWPATWTWAQANVLAFPLMITLLVTTVLARWLAMRRALARRGPRRSKHAHYRQQPRVVQVTQVEDQVLMDAAGNIVGFAETASAEEHVLPAVTADKASTTPVPVYRDPNEHFDRKQRDWKLDLVRIPFWYMLSSAATLAVCLALDVLVLRPYTLQLAPPAAAAVNHPFVDLALAVLHTGVVAASMAALARTAGFVRKEWDQYQRGE